MRTANEGNRSMIIRKNIWISLTILIAGVLVSLGCSRQPNAKQTEQQVKSVNVETRTVRPATFTSYVRLVGTVESDNDIRLASEAGGRILEYFVSKGDFVRQGDLIAKIDDQQLQQELERMKAVTEQSRERFQRQRRIWLEDSIGSEIEYLNAKYTYQQNRASLERLRVQLNNTNVRAPFSGTVEDIITEEGEMVSPGTPLIHLIGAGYLKITAGVPARYSEVVQPGDSARIWFDTQQSDTLTGTINFVGTSINENNRTFPIELSFPESENHRKVGMIANIRLRTRLQPNSVVINEEFLYEQQGETVVYTVGQNEDGETVALERIVEKGPAHANRVKIESGLSPGDRLITVGSSFLDDSMRIKIVDNPDLISRAAGTETDTSSSSIESEQ